MKRTYQIEKQRALEKFRKAAGESNEKIQLVFPLAQVLALVQNGLMQLAVEAFTMLSQEMMKCEVGLLVGPKNRADATRSMLRLGNANGLLCGGRPRGAAATSPGA